MTTSDHSLVFACLSTTRGILSCANAMLPRMGADCSLTKYIHALQYETPQWLVGLVMRHAEALLLLAESALWY
jgi:hypothetical protein